MSQCPDNRCHMIYQNTQGTNRSQRNLGHSRRRLRYRTPFFYRLWESRLSRARTTLGGQATHVGILVGWVETQWHKINTRETLDDAVAGELVGRLALVYFCIRTRTTYNHWAYNQPPFSYTPFSFVSVTSSSLGQPHSDTTATLSIFPSRFRATRNHTCVLALFASRRSLTLKNSTHFILSFFFFCLTFYYYYYSILRA